VHLRSNNNLASLLCSIGCISLRTKHEPRLIDPYLTPVC